MLHGRTEFENNISGRNPQEKKVGKELRSILLALSFLVKKAEKGRVFTVCLLLKEFFV
jgi:hypothetical protein